MDARASQLLALIEHAFAGVELGDGISLREAAVIDGYGSDEERREARSEDEQKDWRAVTYDDLTFYLTHPYMGFCFIDTAGSRFYLPACLTKLIESDYAPSPEDVTLDTLSNVVIRELCSDGRVGGVRFLLLSPAQRACVGEVLRYWRARLEPLSEDDIYATLTVEEFDPAFARRELAAQIDSAAREIWGVPPDEISARLG